MLDFGKTVLFSLPADGKIYEGMIIRIKYKYIVQYAAEGAEWQEEIGPENIYARQSITAREITQRLVAESANVPDFHVALKKFPTGRRERFFPPDHPIEINWAECVKELRRIPTPQITKKIPDVLARHTRHPDDRRPVWRVFAGPIRPGRKSRAK